MAQSFDPAQDKTLRMLVVGAGNMGRAWLGALAADPRWRVMGLVDVSEEALTMAGESYGVPLEARFRELEAALDGTEPDAVLVVTPPEAHRDAILAALRRGLPILSEKPLAATLVEGAEILNEVRARRGVVMVGQGRRWLPHIVALRQAIASGVVGEVGYLTCQFHIPFRFGGWREQMAEVLLEDLAIHHFDTVRFVTGRDGRLVFAHSFRPSWSWFVGNPCATVTLLLEGDLPVHYFGSWVARGPRTSWDGELLVVGSEGALLVRQDETVWHYRGEETEPVPFPLPTLVPSRLALGLERFTQTVLGQGPPDPDVEDNIHSLAIVSAAVLSARTGQPVDIEAHLRQAGWTPKAGEGSP